MKVDRLFWVRTKGSIQQAFSYAKDSQAEKFAGKYGGVTVPSIDVDDELSSIIGGGVVYSYLKNASPETSGTPSQGSEDYSVFGKLNGVWSKVAGKTSISDANTEAKNIIKSYESVAVVKK